ncbi:hypothetical protein B7486_54740 [cyanobacterium TDX16]|nr:hypothetical protein B7486_54740 [cyanobacterium TDX16]
MGGFLGEDGPLGPDSVAWRVHADPAMFVGGLRALLVQTLHPLAMAGVHDHSDFRNDPFGRLHRTSAFVGSTTYGSWEQALHAVGVVRRVHVHVRGTAPDGRPYEASDPHLISWVHVAEVDSFLRAYQRYGSRPLSPAEADQYVDELATVAELLDAETVPRSVAELREVLEAFRPELEVGDQARETVRFLMWPPVPLAMRGAYGLVAAAAVGLLPGFARRDLGLPTVPFADPLVVRPATVVATRSLGFVLGRLPTPDEVQAAAAQRAQPTGEGEAA